MKYLHLFQYKNLLLLCFVQLLFRFVFLQPHGIFLALASWQYLLLVFSSVCIFAGGALLYAQAYATNTLNGLTNKTTEYLYILLTSISVGIGFYLSNVIQRPNFAILFIILSATVYLYVTSFIKMAYLNTLLLALLATFGLLLPIVFDLFPATYQGNQLQMAFFCKVMLWYAAFAFCMIVLEKTVATKLSYSVTIQTLWLKIELIIGSILILSFVFYACYTAFQSLLYATCLYGLTLVAAPFIYCIVLLFQAKNSQNYTYISTVLRFIFWFGIGSITIFSYNLF